MHLSWLEVSHLLLLTLLARLLALLGWQWAVPCKVTKLSTVVARKQIGAHPRLLHPHLLLILLRNRRPNCPPVAECTEGAYIPTTAVAGAERGLDVGPTAPDGTSEEHC